MAWHRVGVLLEAAAPGGDVRRPLVGVVDVPHVYFWAYRACTELSGVEL